ncbi:MAG: hypothetical protein H0W15_10960 [Gemmatimonadales bacterium]|nr:hypothetical protein [Gemmatimonadales bacterium]
MTAWAVLLIGVMVVGSPPAAAQSPAPSFEWLVGCWRMERGATVIDEHWGDMRGGLMLGTSRTLRSGRATGHEFSRITTGPSGTTFDAMPSGQSPASFPAVVIAPDSVMFANPAHDFPKFIAYRRISADSLHARVGADGRTIDFRYARVQCIGSGAR